MYKDSKAYRNLTKLVQTPWLKEHKTQKWRLTQSDIRGWPELDGDERVKRLDLLSRAFVQLPMEYLRRVGSKRDGGYFVPSGLHSPQVLLSPGVGKVIDFDRDLASTGTKCYLLDGSVESPKDLLEGMDFTPDFLGKSAVSPQFNSIQSWLDSLPDSSSHVWLQMDIEGGEWEILNSESALTLGRVECLIIELHDLHVLMHPTRGELYKKVLEKLEMVFVPVACNFNNYELSVEFGFATIPPVVEITYVLRNSPEVSSLPVDILGGVSRSHTRNHPFLPRVRFGREG